jgi:hypothetical protein
MKSKRDFCMRHARAKMIGTIGWLVVVLLFPTGLARTASGQTQMQEKVNYGGWPNCVRLTNGKVELIATTDVGPRIIRFGFVGGQNLLKEFADQMGKTGGNEWRSFGGHRLWHAPEASPRTYAPDNEPIKYSWDGKTLKLIQPVEPSTGIAKEVEITLDASDNHVTIVHRLTNRNPWDVELAPWSLTVMAAGGRAIFPQEPYRPHPEYLLPVRPMVLWGYTDMKDPRWTWGTRYIQLRQDSRATTKQKIGLMNTLGWAAYQLGGDVFLKRFRYEANATYPDFGCNNESYTDPDMLEIETLGPLAKLAAGRAVEHTEHWFLYRATFDQSEPAIDKSLLPLVQQTEKYNQ